ncbi:winged helix-turn-helix transcriptional regulator [Thiohalobacter thiocyanaticus]|uniref:Winged helix-turn-helix transcriptional regulator n=1 Tax=Thiohalobacter thiocyanaticus TaxID=585455 RepID=A0A426QFV5_9GAMM|nr:winged helix-turn-helix transcriptional regulator [Thiohalobacter thiocyanaticus]
MSPVGADAGVFHRLSGDASQGGHPDARGDGRAPAPDHRSCQEPRVDGCIRASYANLLLQLAIEEDGRLVTPSLTQQDIADQVGSSREMVSRILKDLRAGNYISMDGKRFVINKRIPDRW